MLGRVFGRATVIGPSEKLITKHGTVLRFECRCACGTVFVTTGNNLRIGKTRSCGCLNSEVAAERMRERHAVEARNRPAPEPMPQRLPLPRACRPRIAMVGRTFGRLTVIAAAQRSHRGRRWQCECSCGRRVVAAAADLHAGKTRSCGCLLADVNRSRRLHGGRSLQPDGSRGTHDYASWCAAKGRCYNPRNARYSQYGGRGITMCERWRTSFANFLADMGSRPSPLHTLDRYPDNDGPYSPENCRWAPPKDQSCNTRRTVHVDGMSLKDFAGAHGVSYKALHKRVASKGEDPHAAVEHLQRRHGCGAGS